MTTDTAGLIAELSQFQMDLEAAARDDDFEAIDAIKIEVGGKTEAIIAALKRGQEAEERLANVQNIVTLFFSPWGAAKGALWETLSGDRAFNEEVALDLISEAITARQQEGSDA